MTPGAMGVLDDVIAALLRGPEYLARRTKCALIGHADDCHICGKPFCLRCLNFTHGLPPPQPLDARHLAYLLERGWSREEIAVNLPELRPLL